MNNNEQFIFDSIFESIDNDFFTEEGDLSIDVMVDFAELNWNFEDVDYRKVAELVYDNYMAWQ